MVAITEWDVKVIKYQLIPTKKLIRKKTHYLFVISAVVGGQHRRPLHLPPQNDILDLFCLLLVMPYY